MYSTLLQALPVILKDTFYYHQCTAGSKQQKENAVTQMCILTLLNRRGILYRNVRERMIALVLVCELHVSSCIPLEI